MKLKLTATAKACLFVATAYLGSAGVATAQSSADLAKQIQTMQAQLKAMQDQLSQQAESAKKTEQAAQAATAAATSAQTSASSAAENAQKVSKTFERINIPQQVDSYKPGTVNMYTGASNPKAADSQNFLQRIRDDSLSFSMPSGGGITFYGQFDVSVDDVSNGINNNMVRQFGAPYNQFGGASSPTGRNGPLAAISTNSTYVGLRGFQPIGALKDAQFLWQLQTNMALSSVGGTAESNAAQSNVTSGSMSTGTSYVGIGSKEWGNVKIGKTFAPYQLSTQIFNPFSGQLGSMNVVMGNTGGDNRVEFASMMEHSIWYESPNWGGLSFAALFSPGQNRATDSFGIPQGSSNCAGGNVPGSGGLQNSGDAYGVGSPIGCNDGGFSNAFSTSIVYDDKKAWYLTAGYEIHHAVNRGSDLYGYNGMNPLLNNASTTFNPNGGGVLSNPQADALYPLDVGNESAFKLGALYRFQSTGTTVGAIAEWMRRDIPAVLQFQNERQRSGYWLMLMQDLPGANQVSVGYGHSNNPVGDAAGQHNFDETLTNNTANMFTISGTHQVDRNLSFYANYAMTMNNGNAHYDLGAGGHGVTTDCHDAGNGGTSAAGGLMSNPQCWAGTRLQGISAGMKYRF